MVRFSASRSEGCLKEDWDVGWNNYYMYCGLSPIAGNNRSVSV